MARQLAGGTEGAPTRLRLLLLLLLLDDDEDDDEWWERWCCCPPDDDEDDDDDDDDDSRRAAEAVGAATRAPVAASSATRAAADVARPRRRLENVAGDIAVDVCVFDVLWRRDFDGALGKKGESFLRFLVWKAFVCERARVGWE
jgi:hypothetical protein